jgi:membrane protease YdiL (CAAX protease family)
MHSASPPSLLVKQTYFTYAAIILVWILAWLVRVFILDKQGFLTSSSEQFFYWTVAKFFIWILPAFWLITLSGRGFADVFNLANWKSWLAWGGGIGLLIALTALVPNYLAGKPLLPTEFSFPLMNVLVISPLFEEFFMRGAILENLKKGYTFWAANVISALMFLGLHLPGWYFMGTLVENLKQPVGGAVSIFLLGLAFGYAAHRSRSVMGGILAHFLNNLV